jgi:hypothetical protein
MNLMSDSCSNKDFGEKSEIRTLFPLYKSTENFLIYIIRNAVRDNYNPTFYEYVLFY